MYQVGYDPAAPGGAPYAGGPAWRPQPPNDVVGSTWLPQGGYTTSGSGPGGDISGFNNVINWLFSTIDNMMNSIAGGSGSNSSGSVSGDQPFSSANLSSCGDPHDAVNGTTAAGGQVSGAWDSMAAHPDLLDSDSFSGGYVVSTTVTNPNGAGVTYNKSATVTTQGGAASVTLSNDGTAIVSLNGQQTTLGAGQSYSLGNGETVTDGPGGSVDVNLQNGAGGSIDTKLSLNGSGGVDVHASASNVDLGGYLVTRQDGPPSAPPVEPWPVPAPFGQSPPLQAGFQPLDWSSQGGLNQAI